VCVRERERDKERERGIESARLEGSALPGRVHRLLQSVRGKGRGRGGETFEGR